MSQPFELTAEDCRPSELHCQITSEHIATAVPVPFGATPFPSLTLDTFSAQPNHPNSPAAKEILELILAHPVPEERGLTEILGDSPHSALEACFIPNTTARGSAPSIKKSLLRGAIAELVQLRWLLPPEGEGRVRIYELNPDVAPCGIQPFQGWRFGWVGWTQGSFVGTKQPWAG